MQQPPVALKIAILQFSGSSSNNDLIQAVLRAGMEPIQILWNNPNDTLPEMAGYIIAGDSSYEDKPRPGVIAALDPIVNILKAQSERGKPILGIGQGAHILVESGLVPYLEDYQVGMAITDNQLLLDRHETWVTLRLSDHYQRNAFTKYLTPQQFLSMPIKRASSFVMSLALWQEIDMQGLAIFHYCDESGAILNPRQNIAAIANKLGNVMAVLPHPECAPAGDAIFQSMRDYLSEPHYQLERPHLDYYPRQKPISPFQKAKNSYEYIVEMTDHTAEIVANALRELGYVGKVKCYRHIEVEGDEAANKRIQQSGRLFSVEEKLISLPKGMKHLYLVRAKDDLIGQETLHQLQTDCAENSLCAVHHGVLWQLESENAKMAEKIIYNPYAHDCYQYIP